jgi:Fe2+ or Zn2+ uptake regulation protein
MSTKATSATDNPMTKEARKRAVLRFLEDSEMVLPIKAIYVNMQREGYTFAYETVRRHVSELVDEGRLRRLDDPSTFFEVTDEGREWLHEN